MALRGRGLQFDDDEYKEKDYGKTDFAADRKKTNFENNVDDLLFGGGMPAPRRRQKQGKKQEGKKPEQPGNSTLGIESKKEIDKSKPNDSKGSQPGKKDLDNSRQIPKKPNLNESKQSGKGLDSSYKRDEDKKPKPIINNFIGKAVDDLIPNQERQEGKNKKQEVIEQPKHHNQKDIKKQQQADVDKMQSFNRPSYIRKLKKVAEDFKFATENVERHTAYDVVRPVECIRDMVRRQNHPEFVDIQFPPESASLGFEHRADWVLFKKPKEVFRAPVLGKYIDPNDIQPGIMSSPQFLSTLSCLAQKEFNIKRLIEDQKINGNGFYFVRLNINGVWRYICVDDNLPEMDDQAIGARSFSDSQADIWASIIEKAYAKAYSGYNVFKKNVARESYLRDLTGAPVRSYRMDDPDLSSVIGNAILKGYPVIAVPTNKIADLGLNPNYSLSVLKCSGKGSLQLRNSWGTTTQRANISLSKEGVFELSSSHSHSYISHIMIAYTDSQLCTSTILSKHHQSFYSAYSFKVNNDSRGYITISQLDERLFSQNLNYKYSPFRVVLVKKTEDDESVYVNAGFSHHHRNLDVEVNLTPGNYHIYCIGSWIDKQYDYNLTIHCYQTVQLKKVYCQHFPNIIAESFTNQNLAKGKRSAKGNVDEYILYHEPSNLVLITAASLTDKPYKYTQNLQQVKLDQLSLINTMNPEDNYKLKRRDELQEYKYSCLENKVWEINLLPHEKFTWVISNSQQYDPSNFKKWGFR